MLDRQLRGTPYHLDGLTRMGVEGVVDLGPAALVESRSNP